MDKLELSVEENDINNEIFNKELKDQIENGNNLINNNLKESLMVWLIFQRMKLKK